jgi:hypothetical protein
MRTAVLVFLVLTCLGCDLTASGTSVASSGGPPSSTPPSVQRATHISLCTSEDFRLFGAPVTPGNYSPIQAVGIRILNGPCRLAPPRWVQVSGRGHRLSVGFAYGRWVDFRVGVHGFLAIGWRQSQCQTLAGLRLHTVIIGWRNDRVTRVRTPTGWPLNCAHRPRVEFYAP